MLKKIAKQIPNMITLSRIIACIIAMISTILGNINISLVLYTYGAVSDALDGYFARKLNAFTKLGKKLDPISDKIFALSLIVPSIILGNLLMIIPLIYEAIITYMNVTSYKEEYDVHTERVGKFKTVSLFITMILGLIATIIPSVYIALMPMLAYTLHLQKQSINAYHNQKNNQKQYNNDFPIKQESQNNQNEETKSLSLKEKYIILKNELICYTYIPIEKIDETNIKRKELKK